MIVRLTAVLKFLILPGEGMGLSTGEVEREEVRVAHLPVGGQDSSATSGDVHLEDPGRGNGDDRSCRAVESPQAMRTPGSCASKDSRYADRFARLCLFLLYSLLMIENRG